MEQRYRRVFALPENFYTPSSPLVIEAGALQLDTVTNQVIAQLKFYRLRPLRIASVKVSIQPKDSSGRDLGDKVVFDYLDLTTVRNSYFGTQTPIYMPDNTTRAFDVRIEECTFADGTIWDGKNRIFAPVPKPKLISEVIKDSRTSSYYMSKYGKAAKYIYTEYEDLWICTCGALNEGEGRCHGCGHSLNEIKNIDFDTLPKDAIYYEADKCMNEAAREEASEKKEKYQSASMLFREIPGWKNADFFLERCEILMAKIDAEVEASRIEEERRREEAFLEAERLVEEKRIEKEALVKKTKIISAVIIPCIVVFVVVFKVVIPTVKYNKAADLIAEHNYSVAIKIYEELKDEEKILDAKYQQANWQLEHEEYQPAYEIFIELADLEYKDSADKRKDSGYNYARYLLAEKKYKEAIEVAKQVESHEKTDDLLIECYMVYAQALYDQKDYQEALDWYQKIPSYDASSELYQACNYYYGLEQTASGQYKDAISCFEKAQGYQDANAQVLEAKYKYVCAYQSRNNNSTYSYLKELKAINYKDTPTIYNNLFAWKISVAINESQYSTSHSSTVSGYSTWYIHFNVEGGEPGASMNLKYTVSFPNGDKKTENIGAVKDGDSKYASWYYTNPAFGRAGTMTVRVYDANGGLVAQQSTAIR